MDFHYEKRRSDVSLLSMDICIGKIGRYVGTESTGLGTSKQCGSLNRY